MNIFWYTEPFHIPEELYKSNCAVIKVGSPVESALRQDGCVVTRLGKEDLVVPLAEVNSIFFPVMNVSVASHCTAYLRRRPAIAVALIDFYRRKVSANYSIPTVQRREIYYEIDKRFPIWDQSSHLPPRPRAGELVNVTSWVIGLLDKTELLLVKFGRIEPAPADPSRQCPCGHQEEHCKK